MADKYSDASSSGGEENFTPDAKVGMTQDLTPDGGISKECLVEGTGVDRPAKGCKVTVHYVGTLQTNGDKFDSSRDRADPFEFQLGVGQVIKGWDIGVASMRKGEKSILTCKSDYAYGDSGSPPKIPGGATLCFEVELLSWIETTDISEAKDGSLMKKVLKKGKKYDTPEYESDVVVSYYKDGAEKTANAAHIIGDEGLAPFLETTIQSMTLEEECRVDTADGQWFVTLHSFTSPKNRYEMTGEEKLAAAAQKKDDGNVFYKAMKLGAATKKYKKALEFLEDDHGFSEDEKTLAKKQRVPILTNLAAVLLATKSYPDCIETCKKALDIDSLNEKALLRRAKAHNFMESWVECKADLTRLLEIAPAHADGKKELEKLKKKTRAQDAQDKKKYGNMFSKMAKMEEAEAKLQETETPAAPQAKEE